MCPGRWEMNVQEIEESTDIHQPTLSQQLTVLRKADMVSTRREGKQIFYRLSDPKVLSLMQKLVRAVLRLALLLVQPKINDQKQPTKSSKQV